VNETQIKLDWLFLFFSFFENFEGNYLILLIKSLDTWTRSRPRTCQERGKKSPVGFWPVNPVPFGSALCFSHATVHTLHFYREGRTACAVPYGRNPSEMVQKSLSFFTSTFKYENESEISKARQKKQNIKIFKNKLIRAELYRTR